MSASTSVGLVRPIAVCDSGSVARCVRISVRDVDFVEVRRSDAPRVISIQSSRQTPNFVVELRTGREPPR